MAQDVNNWMASNNQIEEARRVEFQTRQPDLGLNSIEDSHRKAVEQYAAIERQRGEQRKRQEEEFNAKLESLQRQMSKDAREEVELGLIQQRQREEHEKSKNR